MSIGAKKKTCIRLTNFERFSILSTTALRRNWFCFAFTVCFNKDCVQTSLGKQTALLFNHSGPRLKFLRVFFRAWHQSHVFQRLAPGASFSYKFWLVLSSPGLTGWEDKNAGNEATGGHAHIIREISSSFRYMTLFVEIIGLVFCWYKTNEKSKCRVILDTKRPNKRLIFQHLRWNMFRFARSLIT